MTPGPMGFMGPVGFRGLIEVTLRNQNVEDRRPFFFLKSHQNPDKTVAFFLDCFGDHIKIWTKLWHFPRLFWS